MNKIKKLLINSLLIGLVLGLAGCEKQAGNLKNDDGSIRKELTSVEVSKLMGNGINLGNTMEAYGHSTLGTDVEVSCYETYWGCPLTTQEALDGMKAAGFDTLRLPVAWTNVMNYEDGDYTIREDYLDRVEEIVGYARANDMYVIINDHWDGGWWGMYGSASEETRQKANDLYVAMWTQIANRFKDYSDYVIFESGNEELGYRLNDTDVASDSGALSDDECFTVTNQINQTFVDTIRSTGGNNAERFLLIAGFGTDISNTCDARYQMPADTARNKLLISVHFYDPSGYCINTSLDFWGMKQDYEDMNKMLSKMRKFSESGYGVVIGEYGVLIEQTGTIKEGTLNYYQNFLNNCDIYGYCPVLWDCNNLYNRTACEIFDNEIAAFYLKRSYASQSKLSEEELVANAKAQMDEDLSNAQEAYSLPDDMAVAWIMYTSNDWAAQYSVGDTYSPDSMTAGVVATDVEITGAGTYTVALDFTGTSAGYADSTAFCALGIGNGETLYPGYIINLKEVKINGETYKLTGRPYTTSDDSKCTRLNLYNAWVSAIPEEARVQGGGLQYCSPVVLDAETLGHVKTMEVSFEYVEPR